LPVSASPKKNAIFGFVLGLILAGVIAYILERTDARIRRLGDIEAIFGTQILAALPTVRSPVVRPDGRRLPARPLVEPLRRLHTVLQLDGPRDGTEVEHHNRVLLFMSPDPGDGRSSVVANLARVQCDAGKRVVVVEADFRRPAQARMLDLHGSYGLADVLGQTVSVDQAMQIAESPRDLDAGGQAAAAAPGGISTVVESGRVGSLSVLAGGGAVSNPPAMLAGDAMARLVRSLSDEYDYVLIDAPPPLEVSDAIPLLGLVDAIVMVASIGHTREVSAARLAQLLERTPSAPLLGAVVNNVRPKDIERYGFSNAALAPRRGKLPR
jgi:Mrp family chromosome partitioning ATPase